MSAHVRPLFVAVCTLLVSSAAFAENPAAPAAPAPKYNAWTANGTRFTTTSKTLPNGKKLWSRSSGSAKGDGLTRVTSNENPYDRTLHYESATGKSIDYVATELGARATEKQAIAEADFNSIPVHVMPAKPGDAIEQARHVGVAIGHYYGVSGERYRVAKEKAERESRW